MFAAPWPDLVIGCGRRAAIVALGLRTRIRGKKNAPHPYPRSESERQAVRCGGGDGARSHRRAQRHQIALCLKQRHAGGTARGEAGVFDTLPRLSAPIGDGAARRLDASLRAERPAHGAGDCVVATFTRAYAVLAADYLLAPHQQSNIAMLHQTFAGKSCASIFTRAATKSLYGHGWRWPISLRLLTIRSI